MAERIPRLNAQGVFTQLDSRGNFVGRTMDRREAEMRHGNIPVARVLLFRNTLRGREVLLQKRGEKPLWGGRYDASIVETARMNPVNEREPEHPRTTAERGLSEELKVKDVIFDAKSYHNSWEGEDYPMKSFITTYTANYNGTFTMSDEVADIKWITTRKLKKMLKSDPQSFTPSLAEFVNATPELFRNNIVTNFFSQFSRSKNRSGI
jgi:isopentenyldiphosphate isomerase